MRQSSLRFLLLRWLLPAMLVLLLAGAMTAYSVALRSATKAYDRALFDTALAIVGQLTMRDLDIADTRDKLGIYSRTGLLGGASDGAIPLLSNPNLAQD